MGMIEARSSGVMYTSNPVDIRDRSIVINAVWGLPKTVVDGSAASDLFIVSRGDPMEIERREIPFKDEKYVCYPEEGVCRLEVTSGDGEKASLSDEEIIALARLGDQLEAYYGSPQDIEWAVDAQGDTVILQCRPLLQTSAHEFPELAGQDVSGKESIVLEGGVTASPGVGSGPVFVVIRDMDALQFPKGAVLVATQSLPRWATLLNRSSAVVTERGSVAGHLANVAREFGVPALFGVADATSRLKGRQMITVDADGHRIYDGRIESLLERKETSKNLMEGSPVYEALKGAAKHIIPLNLLDPDAPSFRPGFCKTFHDITRFCHEKSVHEMFEFGKKHHFHERSSKQLLYEVPMQWWILNLDDGFREEVEGKYVRLENIVSIPMLALWEGIAAFPWEGPPPVDGKGFMSVMFEATRNTALVPGVRSSYGNRNYFMISKNYCSLNSRLGFHFSMVETLVSERSPENYISFQFKGGAADDLRRGQRIRFVGEFLEYYHFRVEVKDDHLMARMEDREMDFIKTRLKIIGYLTIHTRQLDMIMDNQSRVDYYRRKFHDDIQTFLRENHQTT
jgi:pyruvate,water dikinase